MNSWLQQAALWAWENSLAASVLAGLVLLLRRLGRGRIPPVWLYLAGWAIMIRLLLPSPFTHRWAWDRFRADAAKAPASENAAPTPRVEPVPAPEFHRMETPGVSPSPESPQPAFVRSPDAPPVSLALETPKSAPVLPPALEPDSSPGAKLPATAGEIVSRSVDWRLISALCWLTISTGILLSVIIRHLRYTRRLRNLSGDALPSAVQALAVECASLAGLRRVPELLVLDGGGSPFLFGTLRPRVVLPRETIAALAPGELRHVLLHEMLHVARRDLAANWLITVLRALHWWNPLIHITARHLAADRELLRDQQALALLRDPSERAAYGLTLLKIGQPLSSTAPAPSPGLAPFFRTEKELKRRITMLLSVPTRHRFAALTSALSLTLISLPVYTTARGQEPAAPATAPQGPPAPASPVPVAESAPPALPHKPGTAPSAVASRPLPPSPVHAPESLALMESRLAVLEKLGGDELISAIYAIEPASPVIAAVYQEFQRDLLSRAECLRNGFGPKHPKMVAVENALKSRSEILRSAARDYLRNLEVRVQILRLAEEAESKRKGVGSAALSNLRTVADTLRKAGRNAEADAIETELKNLDPLSSATGGGTGDLATLRAEMAALKENVSAMREQAAAEKAVLDQERRKLLADLADAGKENVRESLAASKREIADLQTELQSLKKREADRAARAALELEEMKRLELDRNTKAADEERKAR